MNIIRGRVLMELSAERLAISRIDNVNHYHGNIIGMTDRSTREELMTALYFGIREPLDDIKGMLFDEIVRIDI